MSIWLIYVGYLAAVNPPRLGAALPRGNDRPLAGPVVTGAIVTIAIAAVIVAVSTNLLNALDVTPETWRIAAGMVAAVMGLRVLAFPTRAEEPALPGRWAALVPVVFPLFVTPELVALVSIFGATEPVTRSVGGLVVAVVVGASAGMVRRSRPSLWLAGARFFAAALVLVGVGLIVEGIRDV